MNKFLVAVATILLIYGCGATKNLPLATGTPISASINLVNISNDRVAVTIDPGAFTGEEVRFFIPKTVPGTYSEDNYGKYVESMRGVSYKGEDIAFTHPDENTWVFSNARELDKITYLVNDTYDTETEIEDAVFSPAGTNILEGENFVLNLHGFVGYFEGLKENKYTLQISAPQDLKPTTSLKRSTTDQPGMLQYVAERYFDVIDNPIQFTRSEPASFQIKDITVTLSVYSPNNVYTAKDFEPVMEKMMQAQKNFLGTIDGTKEYNILLYLSDLGKDDAMGFGALEHHTSTVVVMPEMYPRPDLEKAMVDVVAHEFFHIVTPLNVHSEEIQYFDYNTPKMSKHLWMYEGTTEYFANLFQIQQGLISEDEFYERMVTKISNAKGFDDEMSFTEMSENILSAPYEANYANVYEKGTLINMSLDLLLRDLSNGEKGVLWLMKELSKKYDVDTPFKDDALIPEIVELTYPEVEDFFSTHVIEDTPIAYDEFLIKAGLRLGIGEKETGYFLNGEIPFIDVDPADNNIVFVRKGITLNSFMEEIGLQGGDVLKTINGETIDLNGIRSIIGQSFGWTPDTDITMTVDRDGAIIELEGKAGSPSLMINTITPVEQPTEKQLRIKEAWLGK